MQSQALQISYEFFPPRTPAMTRRLWRAVGQLERLDPQFFSMTYG
ncbi:MAG: methylenetetrahydrofolate reductase, partial [Gammaproteobacteria bacterium]|nr:methylenetetrahydrofolate reductase [Gammaproteobacteria bacterium]